MTTIVAAIAVQVYATDRDAGDNGKVEYFIIDDPSGFFAINRYTGWITVARPMAGVRIYYSVSFINFFVLPPKKRELSVAYLLVHLSVKSSKVCKHILIKNFAVVSGNNSWSVFDVVQSAVNLCLFSQDFQLSDVGYLYSSSSTAVGSMPVGV